MHLVGIQLILCRAIGHALELIHKLFGVDAIVGAEIYTDLLAHLLILFKRGWTWRPLHSTSQHHVAHSKEHHEEQRAVIQHKVFFLF